MAVATVAIEEGFNAAARYPNGQPADYRLSPNAFMPPLYWAKSLRPACAPPFFWQKERSLVFVDGFGMFLLPPL